MGQAIGDTLALAVGVAISPIPIIGVVLMLVTPRARSNGPAFVVGWLLGLGLVGAIVFVISPDSASDSDGPPTWVSTVQLVLGILLVLLALKQWGSRPHDGKEAPTPKWMGAIDGFSAPKALGAGVVLSGANPKNLLLAVAAAVAISQTGISGSEQAMSYAVFAVVGTIGVAVPVVIFFALGDRAGAILERLKTWLAQNNAVIMAVLLVVIGAKLIGSAVSGFSA